MKVLPPEPAGREQLGRRDVEPALAAQPLVGAGLQHHLGDERPADVRHQRAGLDVVAVVGLQHVRRGRGVPHDRGDLLHQVADRAVGVAGGLGLAGLRDRGAVPVDRQHAADRQVAGCRGGGDAETAALQRGHHRQHRGAGLHPDPRGRGVDGDRGQLGLGVDEHDVGRVAAVDGEGERRPVVGAALGAQPPAVGPRPVGQRDDVGRACSAYRSRRRRRRCAPDQFL